MVGIVGVGFLFERNGIVRLPPVTVFYQMYNPFQHIYNKERNIKQFQLLLTMNQLMVQYIRRYAFPVPRKHQPEQRYSRHIPFRHQFSLYHLCFHPVTTIGFGSGIGWLKIDEFAGSGDVVRLLVFGDEAGRNLLLGFQTKLAESVGKCGDVVVAR